MTKCNHECEVYSRVVGYYTDAHKWNPGKKEEYKERKVYNPYPKSEPHEKYRDDPTDV